MSACLHLYHHIIQLPAFQPRRHILARSARHLPVFFHIAGLFRNDLLRDIRIYRADNGPVVIQNHPDLKGIFCNNDTMALGVVEAVKEANADILVVGVDGIGEAYESIRNGGLSATIDSFPFYMGQIATEVTLRSLNGETIPSVVQTPQALIDSTNVDTDAATIINWVAPTYKAG